MVQGYNARLDESLGERRGKKSTKKQSFKSRRDESRGARRKTKTKSERPLPPIKPKGNSHSGKAIYKEYQSTAPSKMTEMPGVAPSNTGPVKVPGDGVYGKKTAEVGRPKGRIPYYC